MEWYWIALAFGAVAPWFLVGSQLRAGFERNGLRTVLGDWLAISFCIIIVLLWAMWIGRWLFGF